MGTLGLPGAAGGQAAAEAAEGGVEVRVAARGLADGRVEVALQARRGGGEWGELVLPWRRFVPAVAPRGAWLRGDAAAAAGGSEVRVVARRLADGRVELALQVRAAGGEWGGPGPAGPPGPPGLPSAVSFEPSPAPTPRDGDSRVAGSR